MPKFRKAITVGNLKVWIRSETDGDPTPEEIARITTYVDLMRKAKSIQRIQL
jgi:hypothetical protein